MNSLLKCKTPAFALPAVSVLLAITAALAAAPQVSWPTLTKPASPEKAPDADGFIGRWLLLEPISANGLTDNAVQAAVKKEYFPGQFTVIPHDGDKVTVGTTPLTWHALDSANFNVKLFRLAYGLNFPTYGVVFWAVTIVNAPQEMTNVRLAVGSNSASTWWLNGQEAVNLTGDRRMVMDDCISKRITLHQGRNVLRGVVVNGPGMSDFCVRFIDENGDPVKNLTLSLDNAGN